MRALILTLSFSAVLMSCKESLPPYLDPRDVFSSEISAVYEISLRENTVKAYLSIVNEYDETFDARALLDGQLQIVWASDTTFRKTIILTPERLIRVNGYNSATGVLRFDPGDSLRFGFSWDLSADDGRSLFDLVQFVADPGCPPRLISREPIHLYVRANARVYARTPVVAPTELLFVFTLHRAYVRNC